MPEDVLKLRAEALEMFGMIFQVTHASLFACIFIRKKAYILGLVFTCAARILSTTETLELYLHNVLVCLK